MPERTNRAVRVAAMERGPGPACYQLPTTVGHRKSDRTRDMAPAFSFGKKTWQLKDDSPGPCYLINESVARYGKSQAPFFSISGKGKSKQIEVTPGPGSYNSEQTRPPHQQRAPAFSMAARTRYRCLDSVPAPNSYGAPPAIGDRLPHVLGSRTVAFGRKPMAFNYSYDFAKTPGPAAYRTSEQPKSQLRLPGFSFPGRTQLPPGKMNNPGPGSYNQEIPLGKDTPRFSMGVKHSEFVLPLITMSDIIE